MKKSIFACSSLLVAVGCSAAETEPEESSAAYGAPTTDARFNSVGVIRQEGLPATARGAEGLTAVAIGPNVVFTAPAFDTGATKVSSKTTFLGMKQDGVNAVGIERAAYGTGTTRDALAQLFVKAEPTAIVAKPKVLPSDDGMLAKAARAKFFEGKTEHILLVTAEVDRGESTIRRFVREVSMETQLHDLTAKVWLPNDNQVFGKRDEGGALFQCSESKTEPCELVGVVTGVARPDATRMATAVLVWSSDRAPAVAPAVPVTGTQIGPIGGKCDAVLNKNECVGKDMYVCEHADNLRVGLVRAQPPLAGMVCASTPAGAVFQ